MIPPKRDRKKLPKKVLRAYTAVRNYWDRIREDRPPYVPPPDTWGIFSEEFSDEFYKADNEAPLQSVFAGRFASDFEGKS